MWSNVPFVLDEVLLPVRQPEVAVAIHASDIPCPHPPVIEGEDLGVGFFVVLISPGIHSYEHVILGWLNLLTHMNTVGEVNITSPGIPSGTSRRSSSTILSRLEPKL